MNVLVFSGRTKGAVERTAQKVAQHIQSHPELNLSDVAHTLMNGRRGFEYRKSVVVERSRGLEQELNEQAVEAAKVYRSGEERGGYLMFSGQGSQYWGMARGLYEREAGYREWFDLCIEELGDQGPALVELLYGSGGSEQIDQTQNSQVAIFVVEWSMARWLMKSGIEPKGLIGHSIGELVAATVAGVFDLKSALKVVRLRGELMQKQPRGVMLAVMLSDHEVRGHLPEGVWLSLVNGGGNCVVGGSEAAVSAYERELAGRGVETKRIRTSHAFHTPMMAEAAREFGRALEGIELKRPVMRWVSNLSGTWIREEEAVDPGYWAAHILQTVEFERGLGTILEDQNAILIEVGAGQTLTGLAGRHIGRRSQALVNLIRHPKESEDDVRYFRGRMGRLWSEGVTLNPSFWTGGARRLKVPLPTYAFEPRVFPADWSPSAPGTLPIAVPRGSDHQEVGSDHWVSEIESRLAGLWRDVLGVAELEPNDSFFELGGHSLRAVTLSARILQEFGCEVGTTQIFENQRLRDLALVIEAAQVAAGGLSRRQSIVPIGKAARYEMSSAQKRMFVLYQLQGRQTSYNMPSVFHLEGIVDQRRFASVLQSLVDRHESFRTSFVADGSSAYQSVHDSVIAEIEVFSSTEDDASIVIDQFVRPFDLERPPLIRFGLVELSEHKHLLLIDMHHIASDGASLGILIREIAELYQGRSLPPLEIQYKDFAAWHNRFLGSDELRTQERFWKRKFEGGIPRLHLPFDFPRPSQPSLEGQTIDLVLETDETTHWKALMAEHGCSLFMGLLGVFSILLSKYCDQDDILIGTPVSGRTNPQLNPLVGMFVNTLVFRCRPELDRSFVDYLAATKTESLAAFDHQDYPFDLLVENLDLPREPGRNPVFDVMFAMQNLDLADVQLAGLEVHPYPTERRVAVFDLTLTCFEAGGRLHLAFEFNKALFRAASVTRMAEHFQSILRAVTTTPTLRIRDIPMLSDDERNSLLTASSSGGDDFDF